jgi:hypothetical protein
MTEGICMKCGAVFLYDPARRHVCGRLEPHPATRQTASNDEAPAPAPRRFDRKTEHKLMAIAQCPHLVDVSHGRHLPPSLYELSPLKRERFLRLIEDGTIPSWLMAATSRSRFSSGGGRCVRCGGRRRERAAADLF